MNGYNVAMPQDIRLRVAQIVPSTEAEGPGKRFAIWFQGCPLRCPGCCNPEFLSFHGGEDKSLSDVVEAMTSQDGIEGITLLGGEPFAHAEAAAALAQSAKSPRNSTGATRFTISWPSKWSDTSRSGRPW